MDFVTGCSGTFTQHDSIVVVMDTLTKVAQFISVKTTYSFSDAAQVFIRDVVRLHGVPKNIVSDGDARFTSTLWKVIVVGLGIEWPSVHIIIHK